MLSQQLEGEKKIQRLSSVRGKMIQEQSAEINLRQNKLKKKIQHELELKNLQKEFEEQQQ